jgi:hypothetical protein
VWPDGDGPDAFRTVIAHLAQKTPPQRET